MKLSKTLLVVVGIVLASTTLGKPQPRSLFCILQGTNRSLTVFFLREAINGSFYVNGAKAKLALDSIDRPPERHVLAATSGATAMPQLGVPCQAGSCAAGSFTVGRYYSQLQYIAPNDLPAGMYAIEIVGEGAVRAADGKSLNPNGYSPPLLYVPAAINDGGLSVARRRYLGKTVYAIPSTIDYGRLVGYQTARITSIERSAGVAEMGIFQNSDGDFLALNPLIVDVKTAPQRAFFRPGIGLPDPGAQVYQKLTFADPWEIERRFALRDPRVHPEWPARFRSALKHNAVLPGMTHEMVASVIGYPAVYGTIAHLDRLAVWHYDAPTPFQSTVYFHGDSVIKYDPPGNLP